MKSKEIDNETKYLTPSELETIDKDEAYFIGDFDNQYYGLHLRDLRKLNIRSASITAQREARLNFIKTVYGSGDDSESDAEFGGSSSEL